MHCWPHAQWTWTPFPKTPKWLRRGHEPATGSLTRTRPEEAYLGVLCGGTGGRLSCKKEPPGLPAEQKKQSIRGLHQIAGGSMPLTNVGSQTIYYDEHGSGHPLLLIPGFSNSRLIWWKQIGVFSRKYHVIQMDNRYGGDSSLGAGPYSIEDMADDAAGLIRNLNLGPMHVMGWSMGGFISLELTVRHPELVKKLILVATSAGGLGRRRLRLRFRQFLCQAGTRILKHVVGAYLSITRGTGLYGPAAPKTWIE